MCADGGANRVYDDMPLLFPNETPSDVRTRLDFCDFVELYETDDRSIFIRGCICFCVLGTSLM